MCLICSVLHYLYGVGSLLANAEMVYDAYLSSAGIKIGEVETFANLLARNPTGSTAFWKIWFFGLIPWHRLTVTPASLLHSQALEKASP